MMSAKWDGRIRLPRLARKTANGNDQRRHPCFQWRGVYRQAIESVLAQTLPADEVVVVDDGSSDSTPDVVGRYRSRVLYRRQPNLGPGAARNLGIRESKGELLAFLDSDDLWLPEKLRLQKAALDEDPGLDLVFSHMSQFRRPALLLRPRLTSPFNLRR